MLKATLSGKYPKNGRMIYTYVVTGTAKEILEYKTAQANQQNKTVETLTVNKDGQPLFWFVPSPENGRIPKKQFTLTITTNGKIVVDDTMESVERAERVDEISMQHEGEIIAKIKLGVLKVDRRAAALAAPTSTPTPEIENGGGEKNDELENAINNMQNGAGKEEPVMKEEGSTLENE